LSWPYSALAQLVQVMSEASPEKTKQAAPEQPSPVKTKEAAAEESSPEKTKEAVAEKSSSEKTKEAAAGESSPKKVAAPASHADGEQEDGGYYPEEEEVTEGNWTTPQVEIKEVEVVTGEEKEETFWKHRAKLYRWGKESGNAGEWKERGLGDAKLLRHKDTGKIRFLLRQEKTLKIVANHYVLQAEDFCRLVPNVSSDKIWVWTVNDFADDELKLQQFALKFGQVEQANIFKGKFEEAARINAKCFNLAATAEQKKDSS